jgi:DNA processing protein
MSVAKRISTQIARCGGLVVSGLATGIDGMAMRGALSTGKPVVGLMGCGVDVVYPHSNRSLLMDTAHHGCLLSEFPPETPHMKWNFPKRNRIISGLSCGVLVVEAPERSGALITANLAADQGRDVFVVPGNVDVSSCVGSNALLREGGIAVSSGWDILSEYVDLFPGKIRRDTGVVLQTLYPEEVQAAARQEKNRPKVAQKSRLPEKEANAPAENDKNVIDIAASSAYSDLTENNPSLTPDERAILVQLKDGEKLVDDVIAGSGLASGVVLSTLTLLEVKGLIARLPGRRVCLRGQKQ